MTGDNTDAAGRSVDTFYNGCTLATINDAINPGPSVQATYNYCPVRRRRRNFLQLMHAAARIGHTGWHFTLCVGGSDRGRADQGFIHMVFIPNLEENASPTVDHWRLKIMNSV